MPLEKNRVASTGLAGFPSWFPDFLVTGVLVTGVLFTGVLVTGVLFTGVRGPGVRGPGRCDYYGPWKDWVRGVSGTRRYESWVSS